MIKDSLHVLSGTFISNLLGIARLFIIARTLSPKDYGAWNLFTVALSYSVWFEFGALSGMDKMIPYLRGQSKYAEADYLKNLTFTWLSIVYFSLILLFVLISYNPFYHFTDEVRIGMRLLSITMLLGAMQNFLLTVLRAEKQFAIIGVVTAALSVLFLVFLLILYQTNMNGLCATLTAFNLAYVGSIALCLYMSKLRFTLKFGVGALKEIIWIGFPLVVLGIGFVLLTSIDRWIIAKYLSRTELGNYALAITIANLLFLLASVFAYVFFPKIREKLATVHDIRMLDGYVYKVTVGVSYLTACSAALLMIHLPWMYAGFFPKYLPGMDCAFILIVGFFFLSTSTIAGNFLVATNKQNLILAAQASTIVCGLILDYLAIRFIHNILGVAAATALMFSLYGAFITVYGFACLRTGGRIILKTLIRLYFPMVVGVSVTLLFGYVLRPIWNVPMIAQYSLATIALIGALGCLFFFQNKRENIVLLKGFGPKNIGGTCK
jgi:O-antigen/teichoic acid export membrane protein